MRKTFKLTLAASLFALSVFANGQISAEGILLDPGERIKAQINGLEKEKIIKDVKKFESMLNLDQTGKKAEVYLVNGRDSVNKRNNYYKVVYNAQSFISFFENDLIQLDSIEDNIKPLTSYREAKEESSIDKLVKDFEKKGYKLILKEKFDEEKMFYRLAKKINENDVNQNDFISVFYSPKNDNIISLTTVTNTIDNVKADISKEQAIDIVLQRSSATNILSSDLTTYKDSDTDKMYLVYEIKLANGETFNIDAHTGEVVYKDIEKLISFVK